MPYKKVVAIGDSFTRGDELADCIDQKDENFASKLYSNNTWPALVAKNLQADYDCIAIGGKGNHWISYQVARLLHQIKDSLVIVNWSWFERFDYIKVEEQIEHWQTTHPRHDDKLNHYFYKNIDSELWNLHRNLQQIHSTICLLEQNKVNFIMTGLDDMALSCVHLLPCRHSDWQDAIGVLQEQVQHYIINFWGYSFVEWAKNNNFEIGPNGHPLEKAHIEAAKYINTHTIEGKINGHR